MELFCNEWIGMGKVVFIPVSVLFSPFKHPSSFSASKTDDCTLPQEEGRLGLSHQLLELCTKRMMVIVMVMLVSSSYGLFRIIFHTLQHPLHLFFI